MITKHFECLLYTSLLLILCFEQTLSKSHHSSHTSHTSHQSHTSHHPSHHETHSNPSSNHYPSHHESYSNPSSNHYPDHHESYSNPSSNHYPEHHDSYSNSGSNHYPNHNDNSPFNEGHFNIGWNIPTPPPVVIHPEHRPHIGYNPPQSGYNNPSNHPSSYGSHESYQTTHPSFDHHPNVNPSYNPIHPGTYQNPTQPINIHINDRTYPQTTRRVVHYYSHNDPYRRHNYYHTDSRNRVQVVPEKKVLVSDEYVPSPNSTCGMTLCSHTVNYPLVQINDVVARGRQMLSYGENALRMKGLSSQNFTSKYDSFWYGQEAPVHDFVDPSNTCKEHVSSVYPLEGFSSEDKNRYYIVNVPNLRQGLTNMECSSSYHVCRQADVPASELRSCQQMYREEQLLVLPYNRRTFNVEDFKLKNFHVPTGCACIAET